MNAGRLITALFIITGCFLHKATCQSISSKAFKTLNVADGLPQSFISGLVQDSTGFIWIGTRDGLARYDGKKFKVFRHIQGNRATLLNNTITDLHLDKHSRLWIAYETGDIDVLDTRTEALFHFTRDPVYASVYGLLRTGHSIAEDAKGNTWLLSGNGGVFVCNLNKHTIGFYSDTALGLQNNKIAGINADKGRILLVTDTALVTLNDNRNIVQAVPYTFSHPHVFDPAKKWKDALPVVRKTGEVVILDEDRLILYHPVTRSFTIIPLPGKKNSLVTNMAEDSQGYIFFSYNRSVYVLSPENKISIRMPEEESPAFGYKSILIDHSGILWLGGNGSGVHLYDLRLSRWSAQAYVKSFHADILQRDLRVPVSEIKNTFLYDMQPFVFRWVKNNDGKMWFSKAVRDPVAQPQICYYQNGHLIQPSWHYTDTAGSTHNHINAMAYSRSGKLWGMDFFLRPVYFDTLDHAVTVYPPVAVTNYERATYNVNSLLIDNEDTFWISTALNGLYCYNKRNGTTVNYTYSEVPGSLPTNQLMNLVQDPADPATLWIGSMGGGLIKFNKNTGRCKVFTTSEGLPNNTVYAVIMDSRGILWCSSNKGIFSFDRQTGLVRSFTSKDGLQSDEFNRYHFLQLPDGRIAFGGIEGYTVFDPLHIADDNFQPPIALTGIRINNAPADFGYPASPFKSAVNSLKQIELPYDQNFLSFEFAALQYNITEKLQYRYKLEGVDNRWVNAGNDNIATYTGIAPGHYVLKINAANTAGKWSAYIKALPVVIRPPFWKTWWFIALAVLAAAAFIIFLIQRRIAGVRKEEKQKALFEREASELKAQALRAQMNPHFIFNCLNSIKALIQKDNKQQAVSYLTTFSKLIRNQLNNAQLEVSLYDELQTCRLYAQLEALRFGSTIVCEFEVDENIDTHSLLVPPLIVQPFIENAIWHGILPKDGGKVTVSVTQQENAIQCIIDDDGIGRDMAKRNKSQTSSTYESKGMKLVQNRLNLYNTIHHHGGSIEVIDKKDSNNHPAGTLVIVKFKEEA